MIIHWIPYEMIMRPVELSCYRSYENARTTAWELDIFFFENQQHQKPNLGWVENNQLIGGLEHFLFFHILGIIIPTDFHIFQRG